MMDTKTIGSIILDVNEKDGIVEFLGNSWGVDSYRRTVSAVGFQRVDSGLRSVRRCKGGTHQAPVESQTVSDHWQDGGRPV